MKSATGSLSTTAGMLLFLALLFAATVMAAAGTPVLAATSEALNGDEIVAVFPKFFPPYYVEGEDGRYTGFGIEVLNVLAERVGLKVRYEAKDTWADTFEAMKVREAEVIPNLGITEDRKEGASFTAPADSFRISVFILRNTTGIDSVDDLSSHVVGAVKMAREADNIRVRDSASLAGG